MRIKKIEAKKRKFDEEAERKEKEANQMKVTNFIADETYPLNHPVQMVADYATIN